METIYLGIVIFLFVLAVFDLTVGVSNDAVNFLNSAIGAKAAKFRTILIIAAIGVFVGATFSNGMMEIARHGIFRPEQFYFEELMCIFLAVMVTDVVLLDIFNSYGMPTSTTVSMVFELLGGTFALAILKMATDTTGDLTFADLLNTEKALSVILGIFLSVAVAFFFGTVVQYIARVVFTFNYTRKLKYSIALFGGVAATAIVYFMLIKGVKDSSFMTAEYKTWVKENTGLLVLGFFAFFTVLMQILHWCKVNVFKVVVLLGTFALALAFAGNDLVNFVGVPLAGYSAFVDYTANGAGDASSYLMTSLNEPAHTPFYFLFAAGVIMVVSLMTSKKAYNVVKTSVDLSRQDAGEEMFGSSKMARRLVRSTTTAATSVIKVVPDGMKRWLNKRFDQDEVILENGAAFDLVRASVNLVLAGLLIALGTSLKLPLSTTYVAFMVAMGSSLADKAWGRETAVFRVTGVLSVIGGWFVTAGAAFVLCFFVTLIMYYGGITAMIALIVLAVYLLIRSNMAYRNKLKKEQGDVVFKEMVASREKSETWSLLKKHVSQSEELFINYAAETYSNIIEGFINEDYRKLRRAEIDIRDEKINLKKDRRKETLGMRRIDVSLANEQNTWFHLARNSAEQINYTLLRICEPCSEHIDNNFNPLPTDCKNEFAPLAEELISLLAKSAQIVKSGHYKEVETTRAVCEELKSKMLSVRSVQQNRIQDETNNLTVGYVYLNMLQESQELVSYLQHLLRAMSSFEAK